MSTSVVILGGYGVFGKRIATALSKSGDIKIVIAGRDVHKAEAFAHTIGADSLGMDLKHDSLDALHRFNPSVIINCCGPFQGQDYRTAQACIERHIHYIDLADSRSYVKGFSALDEEARSHGIVAITGASTVPAISSAIIDHFLTDDFAEVEILDYGVTPGNRTDRGIATVAAILSYVGKPFITMINGKPSKIFGWQDLHREAYPETGNRWMSNCDIPDLDLFPEHYPALKTLRFYAGLELSVLHVGLWLLSWLVRCGLVKSFVSSAALFRTISLWFYHWGSASGGMHMKMQGTDRTGHPLQKSWYLLAGNGDGPQIPATPAVIIARKIIRGEITRNGAYSAMGCISREEIIQELEAYAVSEVIK